ncbi:4-hydroxybenzoyl-CoA reductase subunit alpha [Sebaldella termitidis]|jgi:xanthine dehydrogenase molybdenum-binding subunit|uniref:Aldehyde oxidase and xanthine dehydrogenase molybdopterin binding protein n=1 Tax=Sebaldella termitidis (strain ATCC 33386 / NCTC 11300) TaxID=526218 RepID=D1AMF2_SEBTE|nr:xanthine dehydrogenase molybdenum-binding subunit XdhA [Sebaldella termitidis]ACZ09526.1 aldehyde oxidase and xanthine dehydrogenase molybdopterin binding protein [Sebaldella termitidis ATCC 33386]SUI24856.1 4-hydroxybenzoyl-CoA reductase subunit alpha [Sebaldella termitidis]
MSYKIIGQSVERWDAIAKVQGKADYTADLPKKNVLYGKILRATIAHGLVKKLDVSEALKVEGVIKVLTPDDLPDLKFPTAGHPYTLDPKLADIADRNILTKRVRLYGDEIAAVIAENELAAEKALEKIKVEYEEFPFYLSPEEALAEGAVEIHDGSKNLIASTKAVVGDLKKGLEEADHIIEGEYKTQIVQHCHMENQIAYAYKGSDQRWVCVSSTQIPHICRRILGEAFGMPWGKFRVVKPFIGGGFGNKQDVTIEPLAVAMSMAVGGEPVMVELQREESIAWTRVRHAISYKVKLGVKKDGTITALEMDAVSNNGAYASHGHSIAGKGAGILQSLYKMPNMEYNSKTVYTNTASAGAMRGYGVPQVIFAMESIIEKAAKELGIDPVELRLKNLVGPNTENPVSHVMFFSNKLKECVEEGMKNFSWDERKKQADSQKTGDFRRGVGMAVFAYATGVYPKSLEIGGCRLTLNQDGTVKLMVGATEIGQGSDTVFKQMVAETTGIPYDHIYTDMNTDTDYSPFDTGAYASRQSYVSGMAVRKAAIELKEKILDAVKKFDDIDQLHTDIVNGNIVYKHSGEVIQSVGDLALKSYYDLANGECITAEVSNNFHSNSNAMGATFADVEVDIKTGKVKILNILNVHDSGHILNPLLASGQVEGGMGMAVAYALAEELRYDEKTGAPLNNNLLDYKMPTSMDLPDMETLFVEEDDPMGPYGNKALGEPPICSPAAAIRNAVLDAIGIEVDELPIKPQKLMEILKNNGIV